VLIGRIAFGRQKAFNAWQIGQSHSQHQWRPAAGIDFLLIVLQGDGISKFYRSVTSPCPANSISTCPRRPHPPPLGSTTTPFHLVDGRLQLLQFVVPDVPVQRVLRFDLLDAPHPGLGFASSDLRLNCQFFCFSARWKKQTLWAEVWSHHFYDTDCWLVMVVVKSRYDISSGNLLKNELVIIAVQIIANSKTELNWNN